MLEAAFDQWKPAREEETLRKDRKRLESSNRIGKIGATAKKLTTRIRSAKMRAIVLGDKEG